MARISKKHAWGSLVLSAAVAVVGARALEERGAAANRAPLAAAVLLSLEAAAANDEVTRAIVRMNEFERAGDLVAAQEAVSAGARAATQLKIYADPLAELELPSAFFGAHGGERALQKTLRKQGVVGRELAASVAGMFRAYEAAYQAAGVSGAVSVSVDVARIRSALKEFADLSNTVAGLK